jgi:hypothetical protein
MLQQYRISSLHNLTSHFESNGWVDMVDGPDAVAIGFAGV